MATVKTNTDVFEKAWEGFKGTDWKEKASVSRFVQANYTPYDGDESFLAGPTERSLKIKKIVDETKAGYEAEGRFPMDTRPTSIADIDAGYISKEDELIYGIQNDELFKLNFMPKGGIRMAETALKEHGYEPDPAVHEIFTKYVTTVNDVSSVLTLQTSVVHVTLTQLLVFQMLTHVDVSSGFMLVLPFTVLTT